MKPNARNVNSPRPNFCGPLPRPNGMTPTWATGWSRGSRPVSLSGGAVAYAHLDPGTLAEIRRTVARLTGVY
jgi:hypothetical protein